MQTMEELKAQAIKRVEEAVAKLNRIYKKEMPVPTIVFADLGARVAGTANHVKHQVTFHPAFMKKSEFWDLKGAATVEHEVAHLFTHVVYPDHKQAHGPEFRRIMSVLHANGSTYHSMGRVETTKRTRTVKRFEYKCSCRTHQVSSTIHNRIQKGSPMKYICKDCKTTIRLAS